MQRQPLLAQQWPQAPAVAHCQDQSQCLNGERNEFVELGTAVNAAIVTASIETYTYQFVAVYCYTGFISEP